MGDDGVLGESGELTETSWARRVDAPGKVLRLENNGRGSWGHLGAKRQEVFRADLGRILERCFWTC